jgi:hypothetical protein
MRHCVPAASRRASQAASTALLLIPGPPVTTTQRSRRSATSNSSSRARRHSRPTNPVFRFRSMSKVIVARGRGRCARWRFASLRRALHPIFPVPARPGASQCQPRHRQFLASRFAAMNMMTRTAWPRHQRITSRRRGAVLAAVWCLSGLGRQLGLLPSGDALGHHVDVGVAEFLGAPGARVAGVSAGAGAVEHQRRGLVGG